MTRKPYKSSQQDIRFRGRRARWFPNRAIRKLSPRHPVRTSIAAASNSLSGSPSPHWAGRCLKILLRQTVAQEDHNATRKFGISESQRGARCLAVSLVREGFAWSSHPTEKSDWHG